MINFPENPEIGDSYTDISTDITWVWTGDTWDFECEVPPLTSYVGISPIDVVTTVDEFGNTTVTVSHEQSGVVSGSYNSFTVDEFGHITDASVQQVGHIIQDSGIDMPDRRNLDFRRMIVTDTPLFNSTVVTRPPSVSVGIDPPTNELLEGDEWIDSVNWKKYIYYNNYWVETGKIDCFTNLPVNTDDGCCPPVDNSYNSTLLMISNQENQQLGFIYYDGTSYWEYLGTTNGDISDYRALVSPSSDTNYIEVTFSELHNLMDNSELEASLFYLVTDFSTIHLIENTTIINIGTIEPILTYAISNSQLSTNCKSLIFENDLIEIDWFDRLVEDGITPRAGKIVYRKDLNKNISTYYDWRNVKFRRWKLLEKTAETVTNFNDTTLEFSRIFSQPYQTGILSQYHEFYVSFSEDVDHPAGNVSMRFNNTTSSPTHRILSSTYSDIFIENYFKGRTGTLIFFNEILPNTSGRFFMYLDNYKNGSELENMYYSITDDTHIILGNNHFYTVDTNDFEDYLTFNTENISDIEIGYNSYNNVFLEETLSLENIKIGSNSIGNTFQSNVFNLNIGDNSSFNIFYGLVSEFVLANNSNNNNFINSCVNANILAKSSRNTIINALSLTILNIFEFNTYVSTISLKSEGLLRQSGFYFNNSSNGFVGLLKNISGSLYWNVTGLNISIDKNRNNSVFYPNMQGNVLYTSNSNLNFINALNIESLGSTIGTDIPLGRDEANNVVRTFNPYTYNGISRRSSVTNDLTLGGVIIEPTNDFILFRNLNTEIRNELLLLLRNRVNTLFSSTVFNTTTFNMKGILGNKILLVVDDVVSILNFDGSIYSPNGLPFLFRGINRQVLIHEDYLFLCSNYGAVFSRYDSNFNLITIPDKLTVIKVDALTGEVVPEFTWSTTSTFNGFPLLFRFTIVDGGNIYVESSMFVYSAGSPSLFYRHVINGVDGTFLYGGSVGLCMDVFGCGNQTNTQAMVTDKFNRVYIAFSYDHFIDSPNGVIRGIFRLLFNGSSISVDDTFRLDIQTYPTNSGNSITSMFVTSDNKLIIYHHRFTSNLVVEDGFEINHIAKFNEDGSVDRTFGVSVGNKVGIRDVTILTGIDERLDMKEERPGIYRLSPLVGLTDFDSGSVMFTYDTDTGRIQRDYIFIDENGHIVLEGLSFGRFFLRHLGDNKRFFRNIEGNNAFLDGVVTFLHPYMDINTIGTNNSLSIASIYYTPTHSINVSNHQSISFYRLMNNRATSNFTQWTNMPSPYLHSLGYDVDNSTKFHSNSFITPNYLYNVFFKDISNITDINLESVTNNGNITSNRIKHLDGIELDDSTTLGQVNTLIDSVVDNLTSTINNRTFGINIDGSGNTITTGLKGYFTVPYDAEILEWFIVGDTTGSISIDIWKSNVIPTALDSICNGNRPSLNNQQLNNDDVLSGWDLSLNKGNIMAFNVVSTSGVTFINLTIKIKLL